MEQRFALQFAHGHDRKALRVLQEPCRAIEAGLFGQIDQGVLDSAVVAHELEEKVTNKGCVAN